MSGGGGGGDEKKKMVGTKKLQKSYFDVLGLCCSSEVPLIEKILKPLEGVKGVSVIVPSRTVIVLHDNLVISELQIVKVLNQARLEANVRVLGETSYEKKWPSPYTVACGALLLLSFLRFVYHPFQWLALGAVAIGICPIFLKGVVALRNYTLDSNILMLIAVIGSIALRDYCEAGSIVFLFTIAQWLESRASHKATAVMSSLMNIVPRIAILAGTGEEVDADDVKLNTILAVKAGEIIPIDGIVVQGKCEVDEKTLTGESFPVPKQKDSAVWAGTINLNGYISVKTTALAEDCVVARMAKLVEEAQNKKSKAQRLIDKCAKYYTPAIVAISACLAAIPAIIGLHDQKQWFHLALVVLVSACPCALILSTPVATFCALSQAATSGLLVKGGEYLETLSKIKIVAFDKTGTITRGEFAVTDFQSLSNEVSLNTLLYWVSSIESKSSHPMGAALVDYGRSLSIEPKPENVEEFENFPGEGIHGRIAGKDVYVGNRRIALRAGRATVPSLEGISKERNSIGYIFLGGTLAGIFSLSDVCRTGAKEAINELKSMGIKTAMLTGDSNEAAILAQNQLGGALEIVQAELLPEDKARIIKEFEKEAPTAMVGDGLNDAPALATADIGISMGISGSALATETGHIILMSNDIGKIPKVIRLARRTHRKVIENVFFSFSTKAAIIALALAGHPLVWAAVLADVGTCLVVIFNSMLLLRVGKQRRVKSCCKSSASKHVLSHSHKHGCSQSTKADPLFKPHSGCCSQRNADKESSNSKPHNGCCSHRHVNEKSLNAADTNGVGCCSQRGDNKKSSNSADTNGFDCCSQRCDNKKSSNSAHTNGFGCCSQTPDNKKISNSKAHNDCCSQRCDNKTSSNSVDISNSKPHNGCCSQRCDNKKSSNTADTNGSYAKEDQIHGGHDIANQSERSNCKHKQCCSGPSAPIPISQDMELESNSNCACLKSHVEQSHIVDEELGNVGGDQTSKCQFPNHEVESECKEIYNHKMGCSASDHACLHLEKRQIGGCCKSFRKECCSKSSGHFGASFGGGLSEIVIE